MKSIIIMLYLWRGDCEGKDGISNKYLAMTSAYLGNDGLNGRLVKKSFQAKKGIDFGLGGDHVLQETTKYYFNGFEHKQLLNRVVRDKFIHNQYEFKISFEQEASRSLSLSSTTLVYIGLSSRSGSRSSS
jgi:hypothetical protein